MAVGHRVVHGGPEYERPVVITKNVLARLEEFSSLAPLHQPNNLAPIRRLLQRQPELLQVACFDTAFHRGHAPVADHYAIPERFYEEGVRRYGFHGLSYEYIADRLRELAPTIANGRVIVAHLGSGASMCALANGRSVESTMGFTALDGLPMGTRPGQIDPGEQNDTQAGSIAARRGFIGMQVTICAVGLFLNCVLIRSIRREANVQIVAAASLELAKLGHRLSPFRLTVKACNRDPSAVVTSLI